MSLEEICGSEVRAWEMGALTCSIACNPRMVGEQVCQACSIFLSPAPLIFNLVLDFGIHYIPLINSLATYYVLAIY